ncbi:hypothetical protein HMPREF1992_00641 [Selenomonas sp. oral taxon 892 str. F0426]|nr:hypothetical protein HMPREF1992_00641 [Selenomonas sp. oral taxon 892 str. F0426]
MPLEKPGRCRENDELKPGELPDLESPIDLRVMGRRLRTSKFFGVLVLHGAFAIM